MADKLDRIYVKYGDRSVGTIAETKDGRLAFAYSEEWLDTGFAISPFSLPVKKGVFLPNKQAYAGMHGVFADSLPGNWGTILLKRYMQRNGYDADKFNILERLAMVGQNGIGALSFEPRADFNMQIPVSKYDDLAEESIKILTSKSLDLEKLDELFVLGSVTGGDRPKIFTCNAGIHRIVKFPSNFDATNIGEMEYDYAQCAISCGVNMPEVKLFPSDNGGGYFAIRRFDRETIAGEEKKNHTLTAAAILEIDSRVPCLDYNNLMKVTRILTDRRSDIENLYTRMCFNVYAHNYDDNARNFSFIYDEKRDAWRLAPAYDLTYCFTSFGEHFTTVDGAGRDIVMDDLVSVGVKAGMENRKCVQIAKEVRHCVNEMLWKYLEHKPTRINYYSMSY